MPRYDFTCESCEILEERHVAVAERLQQRCPVGHPMAQVVDFRSISFNVYAQQSLYGSEFTGPHQRARYLKDRNLADTAGETLDSAKRQFRSWKQDEEARKERQYTKLSEEIVSELGEKCFSRDPQPVHRDNPIPAEFRQ